jgi:hypothetical protein
MSTRHAIERKFETELQKHWKYLLASTAVNKVKFIHRTLSEYVIKHPLNPRYGAGASTEPAGSNDVIQKRARYVHCNELMKPFRTTHWRIKLAMIKAVSPTPTSLFLFQTAQVLMARMTWKGEDRHNYDRQETMLRIHTFCKDHLKHREP